MKKAEKIFLSLNLSSPAFYSSSKYLKCLNNQASSERNIKSKYYQELIEESEIYLERYSDFYEDYNYLKTEIIYNFLRSRNYRLEGKLELAQIWAKKSYKKAEFAFKKFKTESFQKDYIYNKQRYWEFKAKILEKELKFEKAAEYYDKAAFIVSAINEKESFNLKSRHHKCLATANRANEDLFLHEIDNAIYYSEKRNDEIQINYLKGYKLENLVRFCIELEDKISLLQESKEYLFKAKNVYSARYVEYLLFYYSSKKELREGNYEKSIGLLEKAIKSSKHVNFPNVVSSKSILVNELLLHKFYLFLAKGDFDNGHNVLKKWLKNREDIVGTKKYMFYDNLCILCSKLSQISFRMDDLFDIDALIQHIKANKLGLTLYRIASLTYTYLSLKVYNFDSTIFEKIKVDIISLITTEDAANYVEQSLEVKNALEHREWLYKLPPIFAEKFDECLFLLNNVMEGYHYVVFKEYYKYLENFLKEIILFNSKTLWNEDYEKILNEKTSNLKSFSNYTLGDYIGALKILKEEEAEFCSDIDKNVFDLLEFHIPIRNSITHDFEFDKSIDILQDITTMILGLLKSFPTTIKIINSNKKPWYDIEIQWNIIPRKISLYTDKDLSENSLYYLEPLFEVIDTKISPQLIIFKK